MQKYFLPVLITLSALSVSVTAAFYSITGLSKLFAGAATPVIIMATVLEISKLVSATLLHRYWNQLKTGLKLYLTAAVVILVLITSVGIYGFLTAAYQETSSKEVLVQNEIDLLENSKQLLADQVAELSQERTKLIEGMGSLRTALAENKLQYVDTKGNTVTTTSSANRVAFEKQLEQSSKRQAELNLQIDSLNRQLFDISKQILTVRNEAEASSELGPLKYVAYVTGLDVDVVVNYFILVLIFVFDPLAVSLVLAANFAFAKIKEPEQVGEEPQKEVELSSEELEALNELFISKIDNSPTKERDFTEVEEQPIPEQVEEPKKYTVTVPEQPVTASTISRNAPEVQGERRRGRPKKQIEDNRIIY